MSVGPQRVVPQPNVRWLHNVDPPGMSAFGRMSTFFGLAAAAFNEDEQPVLDGGFV
jgi:hypothetical protein